MMKKKMLRQLFSGLSGLMLIAGLTAVGNNEARAAACGEVPLYAQNMVNPAIMVQLDYSGSMSWTLPNGDIRINVARNVLHDLFLDRTVDWGFALWSGGLYTYPDYTNFKVGVHQHDDAHQKNLQDALKTLNPTGGTPLYKTLLAGENYFSGSRKDETYGEFYQSADCQPKVVIMVTDGQGNSGTTLANIKANTEKLADAGVSVVAVGFGDSFDASQLETITAVMKERGDADPDDYLYSLHHEVVCDSGGNCVAPPNNKCPATLPPGSTCKAVPFSAVDETEFLQVMRDIATNVKAQMFRGAAPAPTTSSSNGLVVIDAKYDPKDWSGSLSAKKWDSATGAFETTPVWTTSGTPFTTQTIKALTYDAMTSSVIPYTGYPGQPAPGQPGDYLCKRLGDIVNSSPQLVGMPSYWYDFDNYMQFKWANMARKPMVYVAANDGALHAFEMGTGKESWRFYPPAAVNILAMGATDDTQNICSDDYCHKYIFDGTPEVSDIYVSSLSEWKTVLTAGLGKGGSYIFALDVSNPNSDPEVQWEFTNDKLGLATSRILTHRVKDGSGSRWVTFFSSGAAVDEADQANKDAWLFAVDSWTGKRVWKKTNGAKTYRTPLDPNVPRLTNDIPAPPLVVDTQQYRCIKFADSKANCSQTSPPAGAYCCEYEDDSYTADRVYLGNSYGNMYRVKNIGVGEARTSELLFDMQNTTRSTPVTAMAGYGYAGDEAKEYRDSSGNEQVWTERDGVEDLWLYFGTGKYETQADKNSDDQQYFFGLFDKDAEHTPAYTKSDLFALDTDIIEDAYAVDGGVKADITGDNTVDGADAKDYRTVSCANPDSNGMCNQKPGINPNGWFMKLVASAGEPSERVISQPLVLSGLVFFTTFIPSDELCEGGGSTWVFALDWETGYFPEDVVFDLNYDGNFTEDDKFVLDNGVKKRVIGFKVDDGMPNSEIKHTTDEDGNDQLVIGTTDSENPLVIPVNLPAFKAKLDAWQQLN